MRLATILRLLAVSGVSGCSAADIAGTIGDRLPPYSRSQVKASNAIETALALCPDKTELAETGCVKKALAAPGLTVPALVAMIPGCKSGKVCDYEYTTTDRLGYFDYDAATYTARWRVSFDFRRPTSDPGYVPVAVARI